MIYFEREYVTIEYLPELNGGVGNWNGFVEDDDFKEAMNTITQLIKAKGLTSWIGNMANIEAISPALQEWSNTVWFPAALEAGIKNIAVVISKDAFGQLSVEEIMNEIGNDVTSRFFDDVEEAKDWVKSMNK